MRSRSSIWFVSSLIFAACTHPDTKAGPKSEVEICHASSSEIPDRREFPVNEQINPCDDFYEFACSKALSCFQLREDRSRHIFSFNDAAERLLLKKREYLKNLSTQSNKSGWTEALANVHTACVNVDARLQSERKLVANALESLKNIRTREQFLSMHRDQVLEAKSSFLELAETSSLEDPSYDDFLIVPQFMTLPERSYYHNEELMKEFQALAVEFFRALNVDKPAERAQHVVAFQRRFAEVYPLPEELRELETQKLYISREKLINDYPALQLSSMLANVPETTLLRHMFGPSMKMLNDEMQHASLEDLTSFLMFSMLWDQLDAAYPEFFAKRFAFNQRFLGGPAQRPSLEERCAMYVGNAFSRELDHELIDVLFPNFSTTKIEAMVDRIRVAMVERIRKNTWLSPQGREGALRKLDHVQMKLVKPKNEKDWGLQKLGAYQAQDHLENEQLQRKLAQERMFEKLKDKRNRDEWLMGPLTVNAYYSPSDNSFNMLQGILQYPFYDANGSEAANFGAIGMVVGHEIGHGFDDQGARFDENGALKQWMSDEDVANFKMLGQMVIEQYNRAGHNGKLTLGENLADINGLSFTYAAAFPDNKGSIEDKQAFFLQYTRSWCGVMRPSEMEHRLKTDPHSQTNVRGTLPLLHQPGFYEAYGCKAGDKMYLPEKDRLQIW